MKIVDAVGPVGRVEMGERAATILATFPGPVRLAPSRLKWGVIFVIGLVFSLAGVAMLTDEGAAGWSAIAVSTAIALLAAAMLWLPRAGGLVLDRDGFEVLSLGTRQRTRWEDADNFRSGWQTGRSLGRTVLYDDARLKGFLPGRLPETYGMGAHDLALLLTAWRERAPGGGAPAGRPV
jgi:hypothetical protein